MAFSQTLKHFVSRPDAAPVWTTGVAYAVDNVVLFGDTLYRCIASHTAGSSFFTDLTGSTKWIAVAPPSSKNYLNAIGRFDSTSAVGWSLFNTTLTSLIPTGTISAGAASITTFNTVTSGQLSGTASLQTVSSGVLAAGAGFISDAFTIDISDQARMLSITAAYKVVSGAANMNFSGTSANTFAAYIYDVTNSQWVQPAGVYNLVQTTGVGQIKATFQTSSNGTQYRLALVCINASGGATSMLWDDFTVGPQTSVSGPAMSDWAAYTPTITGATTAPTKGSGGYDRGYWRRVGDTLEILYQYKQTVAGTAGSGLYSISIPSGFVIDNTNTKFSVDTNTNATNTGRGDDGATNYSLFAAADSSTTFRIQAINGATYSTMGSGTMAFSNAGLEFGITLKVPILGWSSNSVMSADMDTRVVAASYTSANTTITIGNTGVTTIPFTTLVKDTTGSYNTSTGVYTVSTSGQYRADVNAYVSSTASWALAIFQNGVQKSYGNIVTNGNAGQTFALLDCKAGDTIDVRAILNSGGASVTVGLSSNTRDQFAVQRLSGPAVVAASEKVYLQYTGNGATVLTADVTNIDWATKVVDSHGAWNGTTFTAPRADWYNFAGSMRTNTSIAENISLYVNGVLKYNTGGNATSSLKPIAVGTYLNAGDAVTFRSDTGATLTNIGSGHWLSISSK